MSPSPVSLPGRKRHRLTPKGCISRHGDRVGCHGLRSPFGTEQPCRASVPSRRCLGLKSRAVPTFAGPGPVSIYPRFSPRAYCANGLWPTSRPLSLALPRLPGRGSQYPSPPAWRPSRALAHNTKEAAPRRSVQAGDRIRTDDVQLGKLEEVRCKPLYTIDL